MEKTEFSKYQEIEIKITFPENVDAGIFSKPYKTSMIPLNLNVHKRYSDFEWLHQKFTNILFLEKINAPIFTINNNYSYFIDWRRRKRTDK